MVKSRFFKIYVLPTLLLNIFLLLLFFLSLPCKAESSSNYDYPYYCNKFAVNNSYPIVDWENFSNHAKNQFYYAINDTLGNYLDWDNVLIYPVEISVYAWGNSTVQYYVLENPSVEYDVTSTSFNGTSLTITCDKGLSLQGNFRISDGVYLDGFSAGFLNGGTYNILGNFSAESVGDFYINRYYPFLRTGDPLYDTNGDLILAQEGFGLVINTGNAVEPDHFDKQQIHHQGHSRPGHVPVPPTYNSYTWNTYTPPSIDTSTLEALVESLFDLVKYNGEYIGNNIGGLINTFMSNVKLSFEYIGESLDYHLGLIIDNIQNFMDNFYENMASLFQPFFANFEGAFKMLSFIYVNGLDNNDNWSLGTFVHFLFIPDPDDLSDLLVSHDLYDVIGLAETTQTNMNTIKTMITGGNSLYKITIPQFTIMGVQLGVYDIDFSWYLDLKSVGDPIISAFLIFGYFLWLHARLPYWLRGQQGDIVGFAKEVQK